MGIDIRWIFTVPKPVSRIAPISDIGIRGTACRHAQDKGQVMGLMRTHGSRQLPSLATYPSYVPQDGGDVANPGPTGLKKELVFHFRGKIFTLQELR